MRMLKMQIIKFFIKASKRDWHLSTEVNLYVRVTLLQIIDCDYVYFLELNLSMGAISNEISLLFSSWFSLPSQRKKFHILNQWQSKHLLGTFVWSWFRIFGSCIMEWSSFLNTFYKIKHLWFTENSFCTSGFDETDFPTECRKKNNSILALSIVQWLVLLQRHLCWSELEYLDEHS